MTLNVPPQYKRLYQVSLVNIFGLRTIVVKEGGGEEIEIEPKKPTIRFVKCDKAMRNFKSA